jgi:hypothetical protein
VQSQWGLTLFCDFPLYGPFRYRKRFKTAKFCLLSLAASGGITAFDSTAALYQLLLGCQRGLLRPSGRFSRPISKLDRNRKGFRSAVYGNPCACCGATRLHAPLPLHEDLREKGLLQKLKLSLAAARDVARARGDWGRSTRAFHCFARVSLPFRLPVTVVVALAAKPWMRIWAGQTAVRNVFIFPPCVFLTSRQFARKSTAALVAAEPRVV